MRTVAKLTGINPITLRAWERRYGLVKPLRTEKGHRLYRQQDIQDIQHIMSMLEQGVSIGQVPALLERLPQHETSVAPIEPQIERTPESQATWLQSYRQALSLLDEPALTELEARALGLVSLDDLLRLHLLPLLQSMEETRVSSVQVDAEYHLLQTRLTLMLAQASRLDACVAHSSQLLVASLPPERGHFALWHEVWMLRRAGFNAQLLGAGVPAHTLLHALHLKASSTLVLLLAHKPPAVVLGSQLPLLAAQGQRVVAVGKYAFELHESLAALGFCSPTSEDDTPLATIKRALGR